MILISSTRTVLLTTSILILTIHFTNAITYKLLSLKNKDGVTYPDTIITDKVEEVKNKQLDLTDKDGNKLYTTEEGGTADKVQLLDKDGNIAVVIVKADKENADQPKDELLPAEDEDKMINNEDFNKIREELESDNTNSINVQVFKLLPNVDETKLKYWERIKYIIYNNVVSQFQVFIKLKGEEYVSKNTIAKISTQRLLLLYIVYVVGRIEKKIYNNQPQMELLRNYLNTRIKIDVNSGDWAGKISQPSKLKKFIETDIDKMLYEIEDHEQLMTFLHKVRGLDENAWLRTLRDYNPIEDEPYNVYATKCYKRNKYPMTKDQVEKHFNQTIKNPDEFPEVPMMISTLLLKFMYFDPSCSTPTTIK